MCRLILLSLSLLLAGSRSSLLASDMQLCTLFSPRLWGIYRVRARTETEWWNEMLMCLLSLFFFIFLFLFFLPFSWSCRVGLHRRGARARVLLEIEVINQNSKVGVKLIIRKIMTFIKPNLVIILWFIFPTMFKKNFLLFDYLIFFKSIWNMGE
jgi:hypothetical protein